MTTTTEHQNMRAQQQRNTINLCGKSIKIDNAYDKLWRNVDTDVRMNWVRIALAY